MNISKPFIYRPVMTVLLMLPLIVFGIFAYKLLPVSTIPVIEAPIIQVATSYPGASPDEIGRLVSGPLERQFMLMQGIKFVSSNNSYEQSTIILQFHDGVDINIAAQETQNAIDKAQGQLPNNLPNPPVYTKFNPSDTPILYCVLYSDTVPAYTLYEYGYTFLGQQVGTINGVANIMTYGYPFAIRVKVDPQALAAKDISLDQLAQVINQENPDQPTGKFYGPNLSIVTKTNGQIYKAKDYESLIIKYANSQPVRVKDVAQVYDSVQNDKVGFKWVAHDGSENDMVVLAIYKQQGFNTVKVCQQIEALLGRLVQDLPPAIHFSIPFTQSVYITESVDEVQLTLLFAFFLVVIVVFVYLGKVRNSAIPLITLPITLTGTFVIMYLCGYNIDIMSMSALTLAIGFLVDDAIVVLENIVRYVEHGKTPYQGALRGSKQIIMTVISISLCLAIVFVPLLFMSGMIGKIFHEFAAVMLISILFSAFISLSLTPMLCSRFIPPYAEESKTRIEKLSEKLNQTFIQWYEPVLRWILGHKKWVVVFCIGNLAGSIYLFAILPKEFLPGNDLGIVQGFIVADTGSSPEKVNDLAISLERICMQHPAMHTMARMSGTPTDNQSMFFLNLVDRKQRDSVEKVIREISASIKEELVGVNFFMKPYPLINLQVGSSTSGKANYQYILQSLNPDVLIESTQKYLDALRQRKELTQVSSDLLALAPTLNIDILRDQAHTYSQLNAMSVENALMYNYGETYISKMNAPENMYYVILEGNKDAVRSPDKLSQLYLGKDKQVAIESVIKTHILPGPVQINHINTMSSVTVAFDVAPGYALSDSIAAIEEEADRILPAEIMGNLAGNTEAFKKTFRELTILIILAIFVIYIILGILYENFLHPFTPLSALPVAVFGGLLTLLLFRETLSIYALIGLIMLIGIVMKNGILIVDFALEEMELNQQNPFEAVVAACLVRFRPIVMTTFAAMMGSIPVALGIGGTISEGRAPLGVVVIGGLVFSQFVTLFVLPAFFLFVCQLQTTILKKYPIFKALPPEEGCEDQ
jgi:hydrophobic/amphiphilic exporter-1 (mainly G- bacteria), HAE1 family